MALNFNELKQRCRLMQISATSVANECGLTLDGLRKGLNGDSMAIRNVPALCSSLCMTPNEFFGVQQPGDTNYGAMNKNGKKQIINTAATQELLKAIQILQGQLDKKDEQLAKKDEQIASLIAKLA